MHKSNFNAEEKLWSGPKFELKFDRSKNFGEYCLESLNKDPSRVMQIDGATDEEMTKAEVHRRAIRLAQNLRKLGCTPDKRIAVYAQNSHNVTPLLISAMCLGSPLCPLDASVEASDKILQRTEPSFIFCDAEVLPKVQKLVKDCGINAKLFSVNKNVDGVDSIDSLMVEDGTELTFDCAKIDDNFKYAAVIACSSGSTGISKSIYFPHAKYFQAFLPEELVKLDLIGLTFSSLLWISGITHVLCPIFTKGCRIFISKPFSTDRFFDLVEKYKVQIFSTLPCYVHDILKSERIKSANTSTLLACNPTGNRTPPALIQSMKELIPQCYIMVKYGLTENGGISSRTPQELMKCPSSVGHLNRGIHVKIVDEITGERFGIDEEGEICIQSDVPLMGYFRDEGVNSSAFDSEGFFKTGDVGYFDKEGRLFITGRCKDVFKVRTDSVWPAPLESAIEKHPGIRYACVVNVYDDELATNLAAAFVVKNGQKEITADEVYKLVADQFTNVQMHLEGGVYFVDDLPFTPTGKIIRRKVREMAQNLYQTKKQKS